uniref:Uncharacterized protein n=1 Tax=Cacopsylla melanoneura TaxID=428564 RepID=A0A8D8ZUS6_9HEMI
MKRKRVRNYSNQLQTKIKKSLAKRLKNKDQIVQTDAQLDDGERLIQRQTSIQSRFNTIPDDPVKLTRQNVADVSVTKLPRLIAAVDENQIDSEELENEFSYNLFLDESNQSCDVQMSLRERSSGNKIEIKRSLWRMSPA